MLEQLLAQVDDCKAGADATCTRDLAPHRCRATGATARTGPPRSERGGP